MEQKAFTVGQFVHWYCTEDNQWYNGQVVGYAGKCKAGHLYAIEVDKSFLTYSQGLVVFLIQKNLKAYD